MKVDLHIHTTASDGSWTPETLMQNIAKAGIGLCAVTDHDTVKHIVPVQELAAAAGVAFLAGVEVSTTVRGHSFHIIGYGVNPAAGPLQRILGHNAALLEEVDCTSIKKLIADGFKIDFDEYCEYRHDPVRGGWKSLSFLIDKGFCRDVEDFFHNLFTSERGMGFPEFPSPAEVIEAIKASDGVPVLAHPGSCFHGADLEQTLDWFGHELIEGVECFHPGHNATTTKCVLQWCNRHGLIITGGSDCHGDFVPQRRLGVPKIKLAQLKLGKLAEKIQY
jgi:hypothetical protein